MDALLDDSQEEVKQGKDYYKHYKDFIQELSTMEKQILGELSDYREKVSNGSPTIDTETNIRNHFKTFGEKLDILEEAYNNRNAPSGYPYQELDRRQKEIQSYRIKLNDMRKQFNVLHNKKYSYQNKNDHEDYAQKEEFKDADIDELLYMQKKKLDSQDDRMEEITLDVKKNITLAKNARQVMKDQNKKLEQISEDIDNTDDKMKSLTKRFQNYARRQSWCCLMLILILELAIALGAYYFLVN